MMTIPVELIDFVESGVSVLVGTRSDRLLPDCCRAVGARVDEGGKELTFFLPVATADSNLANLRDNGRAAVCFARIDHRTLQIKGPVISIQDADESDRRQVLRYRSLLAESWGVIGIPPRLTMRMAHWPCHAVRLRVESIFDATPGPGAGAPLGTATV
jgi:hypothetical protein